MTELDQWSKGPEVTGNTWHTLMILPGGRRESLRRSVLNRKGEKWITNTALCGDGYPDNPHRGPWSEWECKEWIQECDEVGPWLKN